MKQYCRYCTYLYVNNFTWCQAKEKEISESKAKHENHCSDFDFNEIDAFGETKGYKPRQGSKKGKKPEGQLTLF